MATAIAEPPHLTADLKAPYLSTVASQWRPQAEHAARQRHAPADCLAHLVHLKLTGPRERRIQRRIQDARFPTLKTLDAFAFEAQPDLDRDPALHVFDYRFVAEAGNVVFVRGVSTGKTHLSLAVGLARYPHDYGVRFLTAAGSRPSATRVPFPSHDAGLICSQANPGRLPRGGKASNFVVATSMVPHNSFFETPVRLTFREAQ